MTDRSYVMQFCGGLLLLIVAVLAVSAVRFTYWWAHRDAYVRTEIEVENPGRRGSSVSGLVVSTGARVRIDTRYLMPADGWPPGVSRHAVWYNPEAAVSPGIRLFDLRVVSVEKHPSFGSGSAAVGRWLAVAVLTGIAAFLLSRPYMPIGRET